MKYQAVLSGASVKLKMDVVPGSLVPFDAFRIIGTSLVFRNERIGTTLSDADLLDGYSFAVKNQNLCGCFDGRWCTISKRLYNNGLDFEISA